LTSQWLSWCLNGINTLLLPCKQNFQMKLAWIMFFILTEI
jgi:hypothetical protein